jgi:hypothetical protein
MGVDAWIDVNPLEKGMCKLNSASLLIRPTNSVILPLLIQLGALAALCRWVGENRPWLDLVPLCSMGTSRGVVMAGRFGMAHMHNWRGLLGG